MLSVPGTTSRSDVWSFAWWAHSISSWTNPLFTHALYAPVGLNVVWTLTVPGLALVFSPITSSFRTCRFVQPGSVARPGPLGVDGFRALPVSHPFGLGVGRRRVPLRLFRPRCSASSSSATYRDRCVSPPARRARRHPLCREELDARGLAWRLGVLLALQLWLSTEFALTLTLILALGLVFAFWLMPGDAAACSHRSLRSSPPTGSAPSSLPARLLRAERLRVSGFIDVRTPAATC